MFATCCHLGAGQKQTVPVVTMYVRGIGVRVMLLRVSLMGRCAISGSTFGGCGEAAASGCDSVLNVECVMEMELLMASAIVMETWT